MEAQRSDSPGSSCKKEAGQGVNSGVLTPQAKLLDSSKVPLMQQRVRKGKRRGRQRGLGEEKEKPRGKGKEAEQSGGLLTKILTQSAILSGVYLFILVPPNSKEGNALLSQLCFYHNLQPKMQPNIKKKAHCSVL